MTVHLVFGHLTDLHTFSSLNVVTVGQHLPSQNLKENSLRKILNTLVKNYPYLTTQLTHPRQEGREAEGRDNCFRYLALNLPPFCLD